MSDRRARELENAALAGDAEAGATLAMLGANSEEPKFLLKGIELALPCLSDEELQALMTHLANELAGRQMGVLDDYTTEKACEIHGPDMGQVTLGQFVSIVQGVVNDCLAGTVQNNDYLSDRAQESRGYYRRTVYGHKKQNAQQAVGAFDEVSGDFVISCSSHIRIYALNKKPSEEELRRRAALKAAREKELKLLRQKEALEAAARRRQELKAELAKLEKREKRIKKNLEGLDV